MDLNLSEAESARKTNTSVEVGDRVRVHSKRLDCELILNVTHRDGNELGGNIAESPQTVMLETGDHLHFSPENVLTVET